MNILNAFMQVPSFLFSEFDFNNCIHVLQVMDAKAACSFREDVCAFAPAIDNVEIAYCDCTKELQLALIRSVVRVVAHTILASKIAPKALRSFEKNKIIRATFQTIAASGLVLFLASEMVKC